jgi:hypothetical protein
MKINRSFDGIDEDGRVEGPRGGLLGTGRVTRSAPPGSRRGGSGFPEPPPLDDGVDHVSVSLEAAFLMVGDRYDPGFMSPNELADMTEIMLAGGAISRVEQQLLLRGPQGRGYTLSQAGAARDIISDWQILLAQAVGRSDLASVSRATRALGILGRVAVTRMPQ